MLRPSFAWAEILAFIRGLAQAFSLDELACNGRCKDLKHASWILRKLIALPNQVRLSRTWQLARGRRIRNPWTSGVSQPRERDSRPGAWLLVYLQHLLPARDEVLQWCLGRRISCCKLR